MPNSSPQRSRLTEARARALCQVPSSTMRPHLVLNADGTYSCMQHDAARVCAYCRTQAAAEVWASVAAVATDIMGVSGRAILAAWLAGRADPAAMAELAKGRMRTKIPLREQALTGLMRDHHRRLLALQLAHVDCLDEQIDTLNTDIARGLMALGPGEPPVPAAQEAGGPPGAPDTATGPLPFTHAVSVLDTIPGVDQRGAELLVAEWGTDMTRFGTAVRLAAWTGVAPGNDESAGKHRSGKTRQGNRALRTGLTQMAHAATRTKGTYLSALYHRWPPARSTRKKNNAGAMAPRPNAPPASGNAPNVPSAGT